MGSRRLTVALTAVLLACSDASSIGPGPVVEVRVSPTPVTIDLGQTQQLQALPLDANHSLLADKLHAIAWTSSDPGVATVDATGLVTAVAVGPAQIGAMVDGVTGTVDLTVSLPAINAAPDTVSLSTYEGGPAPAAVAVSITSLRGGTPTGLAGGTITYGAGASGWLTAAFDQADAPATLTLTPNTAGMPAGTYTADVPVTATAASNAPLAVRVVLTVGPGPSIALSADTLNFAAAPGGADPPAQTVNVTNGGGGGLGGLAVGSITYGAGASGWVASATLDQATAPAVLTVQPSALGLSAGTYTAAIPLTSPAASNSPQNVIVVFDITNQATITLSAGAVTFVGDHGGGDPAGQQVSITSGTGAPLSGLTVGVSYGPGASGWLTASLDQTTAPATLSLGATTGTLAVGSYTATVAVSSPVATNSPQNVSITFNVVPSLVLDVQPIFAAHCTGCHFSGGVPPDLSSAATTFAGTVNVSAAICAGHTYVVPGDLVASYIHEKVASSAPACGGRMPPGGPFLSAAELQTIADWITAGAPNN